MSSIPDEQTTLSGGDESHVDEYGRGDEFGCGGVYDEEGDFDLEATKKHLTERFAPIRDQLPETVGNFEQRPARHEYEARYVSEIGTETENGTHLRRREVQVFARGPCFHQWTCKIEVYRPKTSTTSGHGSWLHADAINCDEIGPAVATALAVMREEIERR